MKFRRPCKNPHNNPNCEGTFRPAYKEKQCVSCWQYSRRLARIKLRITLTKRKNDAPFIPQLSKYQNQGSKGGYKGL